jgi:hypothetical protein
VTEDWRKFYNEELHNLYSSSDISRMTKSRRMIWAGHVKKLKNENCMQICENSLVARINNKFLSFYGTEHLSYFLCAQEAITGPCPEPDESSLLKILRVLN